MRIKGFDGIGPHLCGRNIEEKKGVSNTCLESGYTRRDVGRILTECGRAIKECGKEMSKELGDAEVAITDRS